MPFRVLKKKKTQHISGGYSDVFSIIMSKILFFLTRLKWRLIIKMYVIRVPMTTRTAKISTALC